MCHCRNSSEMQQQYAGCLNICKNWCFVVLFLICHVNKSNSLFSQWTITVVKLSPMAVPLFGVVIQLHLELVVSSRPFTL